MGFLGKKLSKSKKGGGSRSAPQDGSTLNTGSTAYSSGFSGSTEQQDYHYRGKNPHRRMTKEHVHHRHHHHPSSPSGNGTYGSAAPADLTTPTAGNTNPSMGLIPGLIRDLETAPTASGDAPARALRTLFSLSEHGGGGGNGSKAPTTDTESNRTAMVRRDGGRLVPVLLSFLRRCERGSSEQYLALLVLNNISIPSDNKRVSSSRGCYVVSSLCFRKKSCVVSMIPFHLTDTCIFY